jgi:hypothetical protein
MYFVLFTIIITPLFQLRTVFFYDKNIPIAVSLCMCVISKSQLHLTLSSRLETEATVEFVSFLGNNNEVCTIVNAFD